MVEHSTADREITGSSPVVPSGSNHALLLAHENDLLQYFKKTTKKSCIYYLLGEIVKHHFYFYGLFWTVKYANAGKAG